MTDGRPASADLNFKRIVEAAREHYQNLKTDINNSKDRVEHIRLTALAQEAHALLTDLERFSLGLVYSHVGLVTEEDLDQRTQKLLTKDEGSQPLDLPEFKSPYTPPLRLE